MAEIRCEQCGFLNPEGATLCQMCEEPLVASQPVAAPAPAVSVAPTIPTQAQSDGVEYYVMCPESSTKTVVEHANISSYYCEGCQCEHFIDGVIWSVDSRTLQPEGVATPAAQTQPKGDDLWLEEVNTHFRIDISKPGGTLGRYGNFGAEYFRSRGMNTVSGEHCLLRYEFNNWVLYHISRTNQTKYDGMIMAANAPTLLEDGKILTLANTVSFVVRIG